MRTGFLILLVLHPSPLGCPVLCGRVKGSGGHGTAGLHRVEDSGLFSDLWSHASPDGAGLISCEAGSAVTAELFRRTDGRGFRARLLSKVGAYLHSIGVDPQEPDFLIGAAYSAPAEGDLNLPRLADAVSVTTACHLLLELPEALQGLARNFSQLV